MSTINDWLQTIGRIGENEDGGITRIGYSREHQEVVLAVKKLMEDLGMETETDSVMNLHGWIRGTDPDAKSIVLGSHLDTVKGGGVYDGMMGVMGALDTVRRLKENGIRLRHTLEVWGFNMEETSILGGTFGSRCITGIVDPGKPGYEDRLAVFGSSREKVLAARKDVSRYGCYLEYHIEQGDRLDREKIDVGVVTGIVSIIQYDVTAYGESNHAGTTMMSGRHDALVGMSKLIVWANQRAKELDDSLVFTVGTMEITPGQENVIPGKVCASFEMRHMDVPMTDRFFEEIRQKASEIPDCTFTFEKSIDKHSAPCTPQIVSLIDDTCKELGISHILMPSGAYHDTNSFAQSGVPIGMIFVPSKNGISHYKDEWTDPEEIDRGADVLYHTVLKLDEKDL